MITVHLIFSGVGPLDKAFLYFEIFRCKYQGDALK